jgi:hypothetical protein
MRVVIGVIVKPVDATKDEIVPGSEDGRDGVIITLPEVFCDFLLHLPEVCLYAGDVVGAVVAVVSFVHGFI